QRGHTLSRSGDGSHPIRSLLPLVEAPRWRPAGTKPLTSHSAKVPTRGGALAAQRSGRLAEGKASSSLQPAKEKAASGDDLSVLPEGLAGREPGRGRDAGSPSEITPRGWRDILLRVWINIGKHRILALGAGVTFYGILAIFPGIGATLAL